MQRKSRMLESLEPRRMLDSTVVLNELMYNPAGADESLEWLELHNQMAVDMDLSDWQLNNGDSLMLSVIGKNLNDKEYKQQELPLGEFGGFRGWGPPRQIAAELMWRH